MQYTTEFDNIFNQLQIKKYILQTSIGKNKEIPEKWNDF